MLRLRTARWGAAPASLAAHLIDYAARAFGLLTFPSSIRSRGFVGELRAQDTSRSLRPSCRPASTARRLPAGRGASRYALPMRPLASEHAPRACAPRRSLKAALSVGHECRRGPGLLGRNAIVALFALALVMGSAPRADWPQELTAATLSDGHFTPVAPIAVVASCKVWAAIRWQAATCSRPPPYVTCARR